jgi:hypothetical protein
VDVDASGRSAETAAEIFPKLRQRSAGSPHAPEVRDPQLTLGVDGDALRHVDPAQQIE